MKRNRYGVARCDEIGPSKADHTWDVVDRDVRDSDGNARVIRNVDRRADARAIAREMNGGEP